MNAKSWMGRAGAVLAVLWLVIGLAWGVEEVTYLHTDVAGTPVLATDGSGNVVWKENYLPYGGRLNHAAGRDNSQWFAGKPYDSATGLSYFGARYYDPMLGRFTGMDPAAIEPGDILGLNRYSYGNNNPYKFVDPDGRQSEPLNEADDIAREVGRDFGRGAAGAADVAGAMAGPVSGAVQGGYEAYVGGGILKTVGIGLGIIRSTVGAAKGVGPIAGGGARLENITAQETARIQNAANRTGTEISVVGSRAKGTAGPTSDWDYVVPNGTKSRTVHSIRGSVPEGPRGIGEPRNQDFHRGTVDTDKPHIIFTPQ